MRSNNNEAKLLKVYAVACPARKVKCASPLSRIIPVNFASALDNPMLTPDLKGFLQLSRDATLIPVAKSLSADLLTPVGAFLSIAARQKYAFLLESVEGGEKIGRYTFLGAQPRTVITARGEDLTVRDGLL